MRNEPYPKTERYHPDKGFEALYQEAGITFGVLNIKRVSFGFGA